MQIQSPKTFFDRMTAEAMEAVLNAMVDPERQAKFNYFADRARTPANQVFRTFKNGRTVNGLGLSEQGARMYAKYKTSIFAPLRPAAIFRNSAVKNALLSDLDWRLLDSTLLMVARKQRNIITDLTSRGLIADAGDLGTFLSQWQKLGDQQPAKVTMEFETGVEHDRQDFNLDGVPIPIIHKDFGFGMRQILASRGGRVPLDTTHVEGAMDIVAEGEEDLVFNGAAIQFGSFKINGILSHPSVLTDNQSDFGVIANIVPAFGSALQKLRAANHFGPVVFYVSLTQFNQADTSFFTDGSGETALQRAKRLTGIEDIKPSQFVPDGKMVGIEMSRQTIDLAVAEELQTISWEIRGGQATNWTVFSAKAPRIKVDANGQTGIIVTSGI